MRHQVQARTGRHGAHQGERVCNRALAHGRVIQRVDPVAIMAKQVAHRLGMQCPELAEGADGVHEGAVHQHQQGTAVTGGRHCRAFAPATFERQQCIRREFIHARIHRTVNPQRDGGSSQLGRVFGQAGDDLKRSQHDLAHPAPRRTPRGTRFQAGPAELR